MIDYSQHSNWASPVHSGRAERLTKEEAALNKEGALEALCETHRTRPARDFRKDATNGGLVAAILDKAEKKVIMVKGLHQATFGSSNVRDQDRIDQSHFRVEWAGKQHHIYVQPNLAQKWEITEIT